MGNCGELIEMETRLSPNRQAPWQDVTALTGRTWRLPNNKEREKGVVSVSTLR